MPSLQRGRRRASMNNEDQSIWRRFRRNFSISLLGSVLSLAIKLGQTVLLTRALKIDDYGRVLIVLNFFVFLNSFIGLRVSDVVFRFFQPMKEREDFHSLQGLLLLCLGLSLVTGLLIGGGVLIFAPWLARRLYQNPELASLFYIYGCTILVSSFSEVFEPVLRLHDRFTAVVLPQVLGSLTTLVILIAYLATTARYNLSVIVAAFAVGVLVQTVPPLLQALRLLRPSLSGVNVRQSARALARYRPELVRCLFNSNVSGYLKFAISPGDIFLLGIFSTPEQVALYGLAKQLTAPLALLQTNLQTAITPEIISLVARRNLAQLKRLVSRYIGSAIILGGLLTICALLLGRLLVGWLSRPEYLSALPVFYALLIAVWGMTTLAVFRPLALGLDLLKWHNLAQLASSLIMFAVILAGELTALTMACVQLGGVLALRALFYIPVWKRLHAPAADSSQTDGP
jgi:O-antigen/teichoic acid export membrane protein